MATMTSLRYVYSSSASGRPYCRRRIFDMRTKDNACVVLDGTRVVYASEAERITKVKHDFNLPIENLRMFMTYSPLAKENELEDFNTEAHENHHESHIYEAFYQSGFKDAAVLVVDGFGNLNDCVTLAHMKEGEEPLILKKFSSDDSPCRVYEKASRSIFKAHNTQGKLMGLAAYGQDNLERYISWDDAHKSIHIVSKEKIDVDVQKAMQGTDDVMLAKDVAFTVQKNFEEVQVEVVKYLSELLKKNGIETENLCMSGGGFLNCPANSKIVGLGLFKHYYASPQPSDGCAESVGTALREMQLAGEHLESHRLESAYLGVTYPATDLTWRKEFMKKPIAQVCEHLKNQGVVAWCQDGAEYGPRALGHRSFLADPTHKEMLDALNKIKGREVWRPLAPIVPEELITRIFDVENTDMCEFMLRTLTIKEKWQSRLDAVCHADGTTRPQLLKRDVNPMLYDLIMEFFNQTHVPCLVNTSLNINGFPIVETPRDFCNLAEEICFMKEIPPVLNVFVEDGVAYEVIPYVNEFDD